MASKRVRNRTDQPRSAEFGVDAEGAGERDRRGEQLAEHRFVVVSGAEPRASGFDPFE